MEIRGITLRDSPAWTVVPRRCEHITVADVKILNYRTNSDGTITSTPVSIPQTQTATITTRVMVPDGGTLLIETENVTLTVLAPWTTWLFVITIIVPEKL